MVALVAGLILFRVFAAGSMFSAFTDSTETVTDIETFGATVAFYLVVDGFSSLAWCFVLALVTLFVHLARPVQR